MKSEKIGIDDLFYKVEKETHRCREQMYGYQMWGGMNWEIDIYTLLILCI